MDGNICIGHKYQAHDSLFSTGHKHDKGRGGFLVMGAKGKCQLVLKHCKGHHGSAHAQASVWAQYAWISPLPIFRPLRKDLYMPLFDGRLQIKVLKKGFGTFCWSSFWSWHEPLLTVNEDVCNLPVDVSASQVIRFKKKKVKITGGCFFRRVA